MSDIFTRVLLTYLKIRPSSLEIKKLGITRYNLINPTLFLQKGKRIKRLRRENFNDLFTMLLIIF